MSEQQVTSGGKRHGKREAMRAAAAKAGAKQYPGKTAESEKGGKLIERGIVVVREDKGFRHVGDVSEDDSSTGSSRRDNASGGGHGGGKGPGKHPPFDGSEPWAFKPGQSGNPSGRPKTLSGAYREFLAAEDEDGVSNAAKIAASVGVRAMMTGDVPAAKEMRQATEGDTINVNTLTDSELSASIAEKQERLRKLMASAGGEVVEGEYSVGPAQDEGEVQEARKREEMP